jgi:hypothetical protein
MGVRIDATTPTGHGAMYAARKQERSSTVEYDFQAVRQINGDLRIDDGDEGPMLKIEFFNEMATWLSDEDKDEVLGAVSVKLGEILSLKFGFDKHCDRKGAIAATKANSGG